MVKKHKIKRDARGEVHTQRQDIDTNFRIKSRKTKDKLEQNVTISWKFSFMDRSGKFKCSLDLLNPYIDQLIKIEGINIENLYRMKHNHPISVDKLSPEAKQRLKALNIDESILYQLDIKTPARIWGIMSSNVFYLIWLDPKHEVYKC